MTKLTRIEEVKKICPRCKGTGKIIWHNKQAGREFEGLDYEIPCPDCQLFPQPLDKELREKIHTAIVNLATGVLIIVHPVGKLKGEDKDRFNEICQLIYDQILTLLQPKIGEARRRGIREAIDNLKMHHCIVDVEARIKEIENDQLPEGL